MRLDGHTHCNSSDPAVVTAFAEHCRSLDTRAVICSAGPRTGEPYPDNETVARLTADHRDILLPYGYVELWDGPADPALVDQLVEWGFRGLKCIAPYERYDHDWYMPVYERAEQLHLPILFHTGMFRPYEGDRRDRRPTVENMHPLTMDRIARSFQDLPIVMAHMGTTLFRHEAAQMMLLHPLVHADLAGSGSWMAMRPEELLSRLRPSNVLVDSEFSAFRKLVLGSDAYVDKPWIMDRAQSWYQHTLERVGVPGPIRDEILGGTLASWLDRSRR